MVMNYFKDKRQSWDHISKIEQEKCYLHQDFNSGPLEPKACVLPMSYVKNKNEKSGLKNLGGAPRDPSRSPGGNTTSQ